MIKRSRWLVPLSSAVMGAMVVMVAWLTWTFLTDDSLPSRSVNIGSPLLMDYYSSVDEMSADADVVVVGTVTGVAQTGLDKGHDNSLITPVPYTIYRVNVLEVLQGEIGNATDIYVLRNNPEDFPGSPLTRLNVDETSVFYLGERSASDFTSTITVTEVFYVPLSFDNALLDISTSTDVGAVGRVDDNVVVVPRGTGPGMFPHGTTFTMAEIREALDIESDEIGPVGNVN